MVGATSTTTATATTTMSTNTTTEQIEIGCQTCGIRFDDREIQREHMRQDWQFVLPTLHISGMHSYHPSVYNLKRKMTSLPPIPRSVFDEQILGLEKQNSDSDLSSPSSEEGSESDDDEEFTPTRCLFCPESSSSTSSNLSHMTETHCFTIPDIEHLLDIDSFLGYLSTVINCFHECLSCGAIKSSRSAVQDHMRGKGHCRLNLKDDPLELGDFWEVSESEGESGSSESEGESGKGESEGESGKKGEMRNGDPILVEGELRLPSGKILGRKTKTQKSRLISTSLSRSRSSSPGQNVESQSQSQPKTSSTAISTVRTPRVTIRTEHKIVPRPGTQTSLIGLSDVQQRALRATELKMEKVETKAKKMYEAKVDRKGNKQKTFRVLSIGKKAGGLEKRNG